MSTLRVACVKTGDKYPDEYVRRLLEGVSRHLREPFRFVCYTDRPVSGVCCEPLPVDLPGWWAKLGVFSLPGRTLYLDLDVVVCGGLDPLVGCLDRGRLAIVQDWHLPCYNSSVMVIRGPQRHVLDGFLPALVDCLPSDQEWISCCFPDAVRFPVQWCRSWKSHCRNLDGPPGNSRVVVFHGEPKPHECDGWIRDLWEGGT